MTSWEVCSPRFCREQACTLPSETLPATIYYVSPDQINFLVPVHPVARAHPRFKLFWTATAGLTIKITLAAASPALFQLDAKNAVAIRPDGTVITQQAPAKPGEIIILYATGLGQTLPPVPYGQLFNHAAPLEQFADFKLVLDGVTVGPGAVAVCRKSRRVLRDSIKLTCMCRNPPRRIRKSALDSANNFSIVRTSTCPVEP